MLFVEKPREGMCLKSSFLGCTCHHLLLVYTIILAYIYQSPFLESLIGSKAPGQSAKVSCKSWIQGHPPMSLIPPESAWNTNIRLGKVLQSTSREIEFGYSKSSMICLWVVFSKGRHHWSILMDKSSWKWERRHRMWNSEGGLGWGYNLDCKTKIKG